MTQTVARVIVAAVALLSAPAAAWAQQHRVGDHRSHPHRPAAPAPAPAAPLPFGPLSVLAGPLPLTPPEPNSVFASRPGTYVPHARTPLMEIPFLGGASPWSVEDGTALSESRLARVTPAPEASARTEDAAAREPRPDSPPPAEVAPAAHTPDTFYVIPGCYAGNRRPTEADLPAGCDLARLRVVPIR